MRKPKVAIEKIYIKEDENDGMRDFWPKIRARIKIDGKLAFKMSSGCRHIWATKEWVIKLETHGYGLGQNGHEYVTWNHYKRTKWAKYLVPIISYQDCGEYDYVVCPRVRMRHARITSDRELEITAIQDAIGIEDIGISERYTYNWAVLKGGRIVIYDYGI